MSYFEVFSDGFLTPPTAGDRTSRRRRPRPADSSQERKEKLYELLPPSSPPSATSHRSNRQHNLYRGANEESRAPVLFLPSSADSASAGNHRLATAGGISIGEKFNLMKFCTSAGRFCVAELLILRDVRLGFGAAFLGFSFWALGNWPIVVVVILVCAFIGGRIYCSDLQLGQIFDYFIHAVDAQMLRRGRITAIMLAFVPCILEVLGQSYLALCVASAERGRWLLVLFLSIWGVLIMSRWGEANRGFSLSCMLKPTRPVLYRWRLSRVRLSWYFTLILYALIVSPGHWNWRTAREAATSVLFTIASGQFRKVTPETMDRCVRLGIGSALQAQFNELRSLITCETLMQLAVVRWAVDFWSTPEEFNWEDCQAMLGRSLEALRAELHASAWPAVDRLHSTILTMNIECEARPIVESVQGAFGALPPSRSTSFALAAVKNCPCILTASFAMLRLAWTCEYYPVFAVLSIILYLAPCAINEVAYLHYSAGLFRDGSDDGLTLMLQLMDCPELCRVWRNVLGAIYGLEAGLSAAHVYQGTARAANIVSNVAVLTSVVQSTRRQGIREGAEWLVREGIALASDGSHRRSVISSLIHDIQMLSANIQGASKILKFNPCTLTEEKEAIVELIEPSFSGESTLDVADD
jgi:hypothetical protein